jgi:putative oxidoreductase
MNALLENRKLTYIIRVVLGLVFISSASTKIAAPPAFAEMIWNYRILPGFLVNPLAIMLPWLEFAAGIGLVFGVMQKGAALLIALMLLTFIVALASDLARGIAVDCGCFSVAAQEKTARELFLSMKIDLLRDAGLLLLAVQVLFSRTRQPGPRTT